MAQFAVLNQMLRLQKMVINRNLLSFGIPVVLISILIFIMKSPLITESSLFTFGITADLVLTVPLVYFLLIRKTDIPKTTVVPVMILGLVVGTYFLPKESQTYLTLFKTWALPIIEVSVFTFVIIKVRKALKAYKSIKDETPDFFNALKNTCAEILPKKLILPFATEVAVFYYGFINWRTRPLASNEFSYHKNSGSPALFYAFILIIGIETVGLHFLLGHWNIIVAWILTGLSAYTAIQVFGFAKSLSQRPISINPSSLILKYGIMNEVKIAFSDINQIEFSSRTLEKDPLTKTLSPLGELESHNTIIHLKNENELVGLYGMKKKFRIIGLYVDEPTRFKERIEMAME
ncbi:hypothetical protein SAMN06298216_4184 [Spirosomataceae bacterium TFI 002]|nr:hypothetical protein SAMN06298216_4184 [Spirosomataceae bacterium TFI 002]